MDLNTRNKEILNNLILHQPVNEKIRLGNKTNDGGYVIIDGYQYDCFLSAGIGDEVTFENDFVNYAPNIPAFAFDGTVKRPSSLSEKVSFHKTNIGLTINTTDLKDICNRYNNIFLKMDVEGEEVRWLSEKNEFLPKIKQIVFECHVLFPHLMTIPIFNGCLGLSHDQYSDYVLKALTNLTATHYLVHAHQNNWSSFVRIEDNEYPVVMELTYIRKDCEINGLNKDNLPIPRLDIPNSFYFGSYTPDRDMNYWPFKI